MRTKASLVSLLVAVLAGCTAAASPSPSIAPSAPPSAGPASPTASPAPSIDPSPFTFAWATSPDELYLPILMAIDAMKGEGYQISGQQVASDDILYQGLASNTIQAGTGGLSQLANAAAANVPIQIFDTKNANPTVYVAAKDYQDCKKLAGKPVGIRAPNAIYTVFMDHYFATACPGVAYIPVTIAESDVRAQALEQGHIYATVLGLGDAIKLDQADPGKFYLVTFGETLPGIADEELIANKASFESHPSIVTAFVEEHLKAIRALYGDDDATIAAVVKKYLPDGDISIVKLLISRKIWYANGGLSADGLSKSLALFALKGDAASLLQTGPMATALKDLGSSNLTER